MGPMEVVLGSSPRALLPDWGGRVARSVRQKRSQAGPPRRLTEQTLWPLESYRERHLSTSWPFA